MTYEMEIKYLKGVGEKRAALYHKLRIFTVGDLLYHFPRDYVDLSEPYAIMEAPLAEPCAVLARLSEKSREQRIRAKLSVFKLMAEDDTGEVEITVFNCGWTVDGLKTGEEYIFYGKLTGNLIKRFMSSPDIYPAQARGILPIYPQTAGLNSKFIRSGVELCLENCEIPEDPLPRHIREKYGLLGLADSLRGIHFPQSSKEAGDAKKRFVFEEFLTLALALSTLRAGNVGRSAPTMPAGDMEDFYASLPFSPTNAQRRCVDEAVADMADCRPMNRLIQGDVGSGKTLVAAACMWRAFINGRQSAVMAPTELLAEQHYATMRGFLAPFGAQVALLTGSTSAKERRDILEGLSQGRINCCVGTHALLSQGVELKNPGLVVTDEQHRFGVAQRAGLALKNGNAHMLVMSATPIPRTLSLMIYGDLSLSVLDELPPGRRPVETLVIRNSKRERALGFIRKALDEGRQAYIVCPLIEQGEADTGLRPAAEYRDTLVETELKGYFVELLHGKMKPKDKESVMRRFRDGAIQVLVSTTVIEVGVDVPNATIMMVENAERFGLSQLHQLRGRVGRGGLKSWCILVSEAKGAAAIERLRVMKNVSNGFSVAEYDLKQRGPGDFFGLRQHGLPTLKIASLADDVEVLQDAQACAQAILKDDARLEAPENQPLAGAVRLLLESVGERPN